MKFYLETAFLFTIILMSRVSYSDNISIGYGLGCSIPVVSHKYSIPDSFDVDHKDIPSLLINTSVRFCFDNQFFIQSDIQLFEFSSDYTITELRKEGEYTYWSNLDIHLIQMPIYLGYSIFHGKRVTINPCVGTFWNIPISQKQKYLNDRDETISLNFEKLLLDFGLCGKINLSIKLGDYILGINTAYHSPIRKHKYIIHDDISDKSQKGSLHLDCSLMFKF